MRKLAVRFLTLVSFCGLVLAMDRAISIVSVDAVSAATADGGGKRGGRELSEEQLQKIRERMAKRGRGGKRGKGGKIVPGKSSASVVARVFNEGEAAFKAESYAAAYTYFVDVAASREIKGAAGYAQKARARLLEMEKLAAAKLEEARLARLQDKGLEALDILKVLLEQCPYSRAADGARDLLGALSSDPRLAAAAMLLKAEELDAGGEYAAAAAAYEEIMKKYPDSVQALKAKLRLKAMKEDEETAKAIKEGAEALAAGKRPKLLQKANNFFINKMYSRARPLYRELVEKYPDSAEAAEAKAKLADISKLEKQGGSASK